MELLRQFHASMDDRERTAIVTGAGKRVGYEIARSLLDHGWVVVAHVRNERDEVAKGSVKVVADLCAASAAETIFAAAEKLPPVRLLVNNAARFAWDSAGDFRIDEFDAHMAINARAPALLANRLARVHDGEDASIVNLLDSKLMAPNPDFLSYTLSKAVLAAFTDVAARAFAKQGIRVNAIAPGLMLRSSGQTEHNFSMMHANNPLGRGVHPSDVAEAIRYLADARCVTGQTIVIDSGQHFMGLDRDVQFLGE